MFDNIYVVYIKHFVFIVYYVFILVVFHNIIGSVSFEQQRIYASLQPQVECKQQLVGGRHEDDQLTQNTLMPEWALCGHNVYKLFKNPCSVVRIR